MKLAIRGGTALLMISCLIGFLILFYGNSQAAIGADPSKVGQAGVAKFPHGVAIHAIQLFPLLCWLKSKLEVSLEQRFWMTNFCIASTGTFLVFSIFQTLSGKSRFDLNLVGGILFLGAALLFSPVAVAILYKSIRKLISPIQGT